MLEILATLTSGVLVGLALGLTGSGGSLFAIPLLLYVVGLGMTEAVPISLLVVGATALLGALSAFHRGLLLTRPTVIFGVAGILSAPLGLKLGGLTPEYWRIFGFSILALVMAARMAWQSFNLESTRIVRAGLEFDENAGICRYAPDGKMHFSVPCALALVVTGASVGVLSGFFGVGGGFLIVPALMFVIRMDMPYAVGSSLAIIAMIGIAGGALAGIPILLANVSAILFGAGSLAGMLGGRAISRNIAGPQLQQLFAFALFTTGIFMIAQLIGGHDDL